MNTNANKPIRFIQVDSHQAKLENAEVIEETPVSLTVNGEVWLTFMCTPVDLEAMVIGFIFNEGLIDSIEDVASVRTCATGDNVDIWLYHDVEKPKKWLRTSGCTGGITSIEADDDLFPIKSRIINGSALRAEDIGLLVHQLFESQELYKRSGGVHTSALSDGQKILISAEDIGRHNTIDKIAGRCLLERVKPSRRILLSTGRISSEMMQKAARLGASIVISRTSPSSLSIKLADRWGITLIGYARRTSFRIYTHPERIILPDSSQNTSLEHISLDFDEVRHSHESE